MPSMSNRWVEVRQTPNAGYGVFAKRSIPEGARIVAEKCLVTLADANNLIEVHKATTDMPKGLWRWFLTLHAYRRDSDANAIDGETRQDEELSTEEWIVRLQDYFAAHHPSLNFRRKDMEACIDKLTGFVDIFSTNAINSTTRVPGSNESTVTTGIFGPLSCRINHACVPNVKQSFNERLQKLTTHAVKTISEGEQLFQDYGGGGHASEDRETRRKVLRETWGFDCTCASCEDKDGFSDFWRQTVRSGVLQLDKQEEKGTPEQTLQLISIIVQALKAEGFAGRELAEFYLASVGPHEKLEQYEEAARWARKALRIVEVGVGKDGKHYQKMLRTLLDQHPNTAKILEIGTADFRKTR